MERQLLSDASDLPQDFVCVNVTAFIFHSLKKRNPTCLCLAVSVLNQSSPMMNVKKNVKKTCCHTLLYIFNDFLLEPRVWTGTL